MVSPLQTCLQGLMYNERDGSSPRTWTVPLQCTLTASQTGPASHNRSESAQKTLIARKSSVCKAKQEAEQQTLEHQFWRALMLLRLTKRLHCIQIVKGDALTLMRGRLSAFAFRTSYRIFLQNSRVLRFSLYRSTRSFLFKTGPSSPIVAPAYAPTSRLRWLLRSGTTPWSYAAGACGRGKRSNQMRRRSKQFHTCTLLNT